MTDRYAIIVDLDHCLAESSWRDPMLGGVWDDYHAASVDDPPAKDILSLVRFMKDFHEVIAVTGRPEKFRKITNDWLMRYRIQVDNLLMRPNNDYRPAPELKIAMLQEFIKPECILFALDDRDDVVQAYRQFGITVLQVYNRKYERSENASARDGYGNDEARKQSPHPAR